jgi:glutaredoxin 3
MAEVTIYTSAFCGFCHRAKRLLESKGVAFIEIDVTADAETRRLMAERAGGRRSVPQIFIGETHVGGCNDLYELDSAGQLDKLLNPA